MRSRPKIYKVAVTDSRAPEMRRLRDAGLTNVEIGERFGVCRERVRQLIGNRGRRVHPSIVGTRVGRLVVTEDPGGHRDRTVVCLCDCGWGARRKVDYLLRKDDRESSCGCKRVGEDANGAKLTNADVVDVRIFCAKNGRGSCILAAIKWDVSPATVSRIVNGRNRPEAGGPIGSLRNARVKS